MSSESDPDGITEIPAPIGCSPSFITAPLPYCFSICASATSSILSRSIREASFVRRSARPFDRPASPSSSTLRTLPPGSDMDHTRVVSHPWFGGRKAGGYSNTCSRSISAELERPYRLVDRRGTPQVASEQDDPLDDERLEGR